MDTTKNEAQNTTTAFEGPGVGFDRSYLTSILGILTAITAVSAFCMGVSCDVPTLFWSYTSAAAYSRFVAWEILVMFIIIYLFYMLRILPKLPGPIGLVLLIYLLINIVLLFASIVLCGVNIEVFRGPPTSALVFALIAISCHFGIGFTFFQKWRVSGDYYHKGECGYTFLSSSATATARSGDPGRY